MKAVRVLAVADASVLPGLRRALSPESIEIVAVASTPVSVLAQLRRVQPEVIVVDLGLSQADVFGLITQLVQDHSATVLALASGGQAAIFAQRARAAGAADVLEQRDASGAWHEESGSPHVLSLRVLTVAASARPRPSKLSLRAAERAQPTSSLRAPGLPLTAAGLIVGPATPRSVDVEALRARDSLPSPRTSIPVDKPGSRPSPSTSRVSELAARFASPVPAAGPSPRAPNPSLPAAAGAASSAPAAARPPTPSLPVTRSSLVVAARAVSSVKPSGTAQSGAGTLPLSAARLSGLPRSPAPNADQPLELIAIGASTGGTQALAELLKTMPESCLPVLVVQHMLPEFTNDFAERLNAICAPQVRVAVDGEPIKPGTVLIAPGGRHLRVMRDAERRLRARVTDELPVGKHRPSVDVLFQACAETLGSATIGVLLTGMGDDGARGLLALHRLGARTLVQDQASCVCFGMPSAAIALGAAQRVLPLRDIAHALRGATRS